MISAALLCIALRAQSPEIFADPRFDKHVSISQPAEPISPALKGLSKVAGIDFRAPAVMDPEVLLLRLHDVPLRDALVRIASACGGVWNREKEIFYLGRSANWDQKKRDALLAERTAILRKRLGDRAKEVAELKPFDTAAADAAIKENEGEAAKAPDNSGWITDEPQERLSQRVSALFDPAWLAQVSLTKRTVFSSSPTAMEQPLPFDLSDLFATYGAEESVWLDRLKANSAKTSAHPYLGNLTPVGGRLAKVLLVINSGDDYGNDVRIDLYFLDSAGVTIASSNSHYELDPDGEPDKKLLEVKPGESRLTIDEEDRNILQVLMAKLGPDSKGARTPKISDIALNHVQHPLQFEPLAGYVSQLILGAADSRNLNVVADVPDIYLMTVGIACIAGMPTPAGLVGTLQQMPGTVNPVKFEGNWMEVDGAGLSGFYASRGDRNTIQALFSSWAGGTFPVSALAEYAYATGGDNSDLMVVVLGRILSDSMPDPGSQVWQTLNLLGALQRQFGDKLLASPSTEIPISQLNLESRRVLSSIVYSNQFSKVVRDFQRPKDLNVPEELFPNGIPSTGSIKIAVSPQNQVLMHSPGQTERTVSARGIAQMIYDRDHPDPNGRRRGSDLSTATFALSPITVVAVAPDLGSIVYPMEQIVQHGVGDASFVSYDRLPTEFKDQVQKLLESIQKQGQ